MADIIPCEDCGKAIDVSGLSKKSDGERFVCNKCRRKYDEMEQTIALFERMSQTVH